MRYHNVLLITYYTHIILVIFDAVTRLNILAGACYYRVHNERQTHIHVKDNKCVTFLYTDYTTDLWGYIQIKSEKKNSYE